MDSAAQVRVLPSQVQCHRIAAIGIRPVVSRPGSARNGTGRTRRFGCTTRKQEQDCKHQTGTDGFHNTPFVCMTKTGMADGEAPAFCRSDKLILELADNVTRLRFDTEMRIWRLTQVRRVNQSIADAACMICGIDSDSNVRADVAGKTAGRPD